MTLWRASLSLIARCLGPAWRRMLLGVFLVGLGYLAFLPPYEARHEAVQIEALSVFSETGRIRLTRSPDPVLQAQGLDPEVEAQDRIRAAPYEPDRYRAHPLTLLVLTPVQQISASWEAGAQIRLYRLTLWSLALTGFAISIGAALRYGYLDRNGAALMAAWPFLFPQFFAQMSAVGGAAMALGCLGVAGAALMALSRRNDLIASLGLGVALGLGVWADTLVMAVWAGLAAYLGWRAWELHRQERLDGEWLVLRLFAMGLAFLIGAGWVVYVLTSAQDAAMTPVLGPGFAQRLWTSIASFSSDGGAAHILLLPGWRLVGLALLLAVLVRWEFHWRDLPPVAQAPAFILPVFTLVVLIMGLQGYATGFDELHMLAPFLALIVALCCRSFALAVVLIALGLIGAVAQGLLQASVFSGCAVLQSETGRYGYEGASCLLDWRALEQVSAPGFALKAWGAGALSALSALYTLWRQGAWQRDD